MLHELGRHWLAAAAVLCAAALSGCASSVVLKSETLEVRQAIRTGAPEEYRLQAGDRVSAIYTTHEGPEGPEPYTINASDVIAINVQDRADLSQTHRVNPDGSIQFVQLGTMQVLGLRLDELRTKVEAAYRKAGVKDSISIGFVSYNTAVENFISKLSLGGATRDPFASTLGVEGTANFPLIGFVKLTDLTLQEANEALASRYRKYFKSLNVTLRLEASPGHTVTVLGEVLRPGVVTVSGAVSALSGLGSAGGYTVAAQTDSIMTVQRRGNQVYVNKFNLETDMLSMANLKMVAGDFIFVPRSTIANVNIFVDQYLRRNLPINFNLSGNYEVK